MKSEMNNYLNQNGVLFAFNIWDINSAKAVIDGAAIKRKNVILQTSASVYKQISQKQLREFVNSYAEEKNITALLHLDHCKDIELINNAIENRWDSVMIDASDKELEENIRITNKAADWAHRYGVLAEAEIGQVKGVEDDIEVRRSEVASIQDINRFMKETRADMIAVACGNAHGEYKGEPELKYDLVEYTVRQADIPFVVHGGSGLKDSVLKKLISIPGVKKINISTDVKLAYRQGILYASQNGFLEQKGFQATKVEACIHDAIVDMVNKKLDLLPE